MRALSVLDGLNLALRMVFDNMQWAVKVGVADGDEKRLGRLANTFWLLGLLMSIARGIYRMRQLREDEAIHRASGNVSGDGENCR